MGLFRKNRDPLDNRVKSVRNQLADLQRLFRRANGTGHRIGRHDDGRVGRG